MKEEEMFELIQSWLKETDTTDECSDEPGRSPVQMPAPCTIYTIPSADEWQKQYWWTRPDVVDKLLQENHWGVEWFDLCMEMVQCRTILYEITSILRRVDRLCIGLGDSSADNLFLFSEQIAQLGAVEFDERYHPRIVQLFPGESYTHFFDALHRIWTEVEQWSVRLHDQCECIRRY